MWRMLDVIFLVVEILLGSTVATSSSTSGSLIPINQMVCRTAAHRLADLAFAKQDWPWLERFQQGNSDMVHEV
jgi:hypothetical protein